ncbi:MAG: hypothetical protein QM765_03305 [Myxococcales bacterium]
MAPEFCRRYAEALRRRGLPVPPKVAREAQRGLGEGVPLAQERQAHCQTANAENPAEVGAEEWHGVRLLGS